MGWLRAIVLPSAACICSVSACGGKLDSVDQASPPGDASPAQPVSSASDPSLSAERLDGATTDASNAPPVPAIDASPSAAPLDDATTTDVSNPPPVLATDASTVADPGDASVDAASEHAPDAAGDACEPSSLVLVPWMWGYSVTLLADGGYSVPKIYCGMLPETQSFQVWLLRDGAVVREMTVGCTGVLEVGAVEPGDYEVAILNETVECVSVGAGAIPIENPVASMCGPEGCDPIHVTVGPCGTVTVPFSMTCVETGCDDGCGGA